MQKPLEASILVQNEKFLYFVGGRKDDGDTSAIWKLDLEEPADLATVEESGQIMSKRCLHKAFVTEKKIIIIGGIESLVEILDRKSMKPLLKDEEGEAVLGDIRRKISSVSFNKDYLKKASTA